MDVAHRFIHQDIIAQFRTYNSSNPILDIICEPLMSVRFYNVDKNGLGNDIKNLTHVDGYTENRYVAAFYDTTHSATLITLYNVSNAAMPPDTKVFTFANQWFQRMTFQRLNRLPEWAVQLHYMIPKILQDSRMKLVDEKTSANGLSLYKVYRDGEILGTGNLKLIVSGGDTQSYRRVEDVFHLINNAGCVAIIRMYYLYQ